MEKGREILKRSAHREEFFAHAVKMFTICLDRGLKLIMENPWSEQTFLKQNFVMPPSYAGAREETTSRSRQRTGF